MPKSFFKQKMAIFFGYNGRSFHGLQIQKQEERTVERALEIALLDLGFISAAYNDEDKSKGIWTRASRTDKGVHAAANAIGCALNISTEWLDGWDEAGGKAEMKTFMNRSRIIESINSKLEEDIRCFGTLIPLKPSHQELHQKIRYQVKRPIKSLRIHYPDQNVLPICNQC
jgi:tRNA pseudouridine(38-40) synthase